MLLGELTRNIEADRQQFEAEIGRVAAAHAETMRQKQEQITRLQSNLETAKIKLREKQEAAAAKFRERVHTIRELRKELARARELDAEKHTGLLALRQQAALIAKRISTRKDETGAFGRQLAILIRENQEGQREIAKLEAWMFPGAFPVVQP
jgi:chromosome segregation ATPase